MEASAEYVFARKPSDQKGIESSEYEYMVDRTPCDQKEIESSKREYAAEAREVRQEANAKFLLERPKSDSKEDWREYITATEESLEKCTPGEETMLTVLEALLQESKLLEIDHRNDGSLWIIMRTSSRRGSPGSSVSVRIASAPSMVMLELDMSSGRFIRHEYATLLAFFCASSETRTYGC